MISVISIHFEFIFNMSNFTFSFQSQTYYQVLNPKLFFILISVKRAGYCYPQHIHGVNPIKSSAAIEKSIKVSSLETLRFSSSNHKPPYIETVYYIKNTDST